MKKWLLFASTMCLVFVIAACGTNNNTTNKEASGVVADSGAATTDIKITASNWKFDKEEYKIKAGETVNLKLDSIEGMHGISIQKTDYDIKQGGTVAVNFSEPGTYEMVCNIQCGKGHRQMKANLIVE